MDLKGMDLKRIKGKAQGFLDEHSDQIDKGISKAEQFAKGKTRSAETSAKVDRVAGKLRGVLGNDGDSADGTKA